MLWRGGSQTGTITMMSADTPSEHLTAIRLLAAMAWADGEMQEQESRALKRIISVARLAPGERELAQKALSQPVPLDLSSTENFDDATREGIYRAAVRCAAADEVLHPAEAAMLGQLRDGLKLDKVLASSIERESFPKGLAVESA